MPHSAPAYVRPSNKDRLYIALYARGGKRVEDDGEAKYHWALLVSPKHEDSNSKGKRFHVKERMTTVDGRTQSCWVYEERDIGMNPTSMIMVRVITGKVADPERVASVLLQVPLRGAQPGWSCVSWVCEALRMLQTNEKSLSRSPNVEWKEARTRAMEFVRRKEDEHRFDGQAKAGRFDMNRVATYDSLRGREIIA